MSVETQIVTYWVAVFFYVLSSIIFISGAVFNKKNWYHSGFLLAILGFIATTAAIGFRWMEVGRLPYWGVYEVFPNYVWGAVALYLVVAIKEPKLKSAGILIMPLAFALIGIAVMTDKQVHDAPRTFYTFWLYVHILFAKLSYGAALVSAALSMSYLVRSRKSNYVDTEDIQQREKLEELDFKSYKFAQFAFIMMGIMIASGAVWAYKAWGRYWGWDPIETWALISWMVYGLYFHFRFSRGLKGKKAAWANLFAVFFLIFAFFGLPLVYESVHEHLKYN